MIRILKLAALALVLLVFVTEVLPWIRDRVEGVTEEKIVGRPDPMTLGDETVCVHLATEASTLVGDSILYVKPPPADSSDWVEASYEIQRRITEADDRCTCPGDACLTGREALGEIQALVDDIDRMISGESSVAMSLANRQDRIVALLEKARVEAD